MWQQCSANHNVEEFLNKTKQWQENSERTLIFGSKLLKKTKTRVKGKVLFQWKLILKNIPIYLFSKRKNPIFSLWKCKKLRKPHLHFTTSNIYVSWKLRHSSIYVRNEYFYFLTLFLKKNSMRPKVLELKKFKKINEIK